MGIIQKQSIEGSLFSYIGVLLGFLITGIMAPNILTTDENGLIKLLVSYSIILAQFASLGFNSVTTRLFPYFRNNKSNHNGYFFIAFIVSVTGLLLSIVVYFILKASFFYKSGGAENELLEKYINYVPLLIFFHVFFSLFDNYAKVLYNAILGTFAKDVLQRIFVLLFFLLYYFEIINFSKLIIFYILCYSLPPLILLIYLLIKKELSIKPQLGFISGPLIRNIVDVSLFGLLLSFANMIILNVDSIMINHLINISATGVYSITFFFGTLVIIPSRAMKKISSPVLAEAWKADDIKIIKDVYYKSTIYQFIFGLLIFIGIWANIDNIFIILPPEYASGKYVIFFIALANLLEMTAGVSSTIIGTSKHYRYNTWFMLMLIVLLISTNFYFIPAFGIMGAAMASAFSYLLLIFLRFLLILKYYKLQPYNYKFVVVLLIGIGIYFISTLIPQIEPYFLDIIIRSSLISFGYTLLIIIFKPDPELNNRIIGYFKWLKKN